MPYNIGNVSHWLASTYANQIDPDRRLQFVSQIHQFLNCLLENDEYSGNIDVFFQITRKIFPKMDTLIQLIVVTVFLKSPNFTHFWPIIAELLLAQLDPKVINLLVDKALIHSPIQWLYAYCVSKVCRSFMEPTREHLRNYLLQKHIVVKLRTTMLQCDITTAYFFNLTCNRFEFKLGFNKLSSSSHPIIPYFLKMHNFNNFYFIKSVISSSTNRLLNQENLYIHILQDAIVLWSSNKNDIVPSFFKKSHIVFYLKEIQGITIFFESDCMSTSIVSNFTKIKKLSLTFKFASSEDSVYFEKWIKQLQRQTCQFCPTSGDLNTTINVMNELSQYEKFQKNYGSSIKNDSNNVEVVASSQATPDISTLQTKRSLQARDNFEIVGTTCQQKKSKKVIFSSPDTDSIESASDSVVEVTPLTSPDTDSINRFKFQADLQSLALKINQQNQKFNLRLTQKEEKIHQELREIILEAKKLHNESICHLIQIAQKYT